jgi:hypothetical protein
MRLDGLPISSLPDRVRGHYDQEPTFPIRLHDNLPASSAMPCSDHPAILDNTLSIARKRMKWRFDTPKTCDLERIVYLPWISQRMV